MKTRREFLDLLLMSLIGSQFARIGCSPERGTEESILSLDASEIIGRVTGQSAQVNVFTGEPNEYLIRYGTSPTNLKNEIKLGGVGGLTATLTGLEPGGEYYYQVARRLASNGKYSGGEAHKFVTQRPEGEAFSFAVATDCHLSGDPDEIHWFETIAETVSNLAEEDVDFVILGGDEAYLDGFEGKKRESGVDSLAEAQERYALLREQFRPVMASRPTFLVLGNHDGEVLFKPVRKRANKGPAYKLRWATIARKQYILNPRPDTYAEGGENEGWTGPETIEAFGGASEGHASPLENYYAWSWGPALFAVLDPFRYTPSRPRIPEDWTIGEAQMAWLERTLAGSDKRHKFVIAHHLIGGAPWNGSCEAPGTHGRGGAKYAMAGEQARIHELMLKYGVKFFLYGHDHIFAHSERNGINYISCGRSAIPSTPWWSKSGWKEIYGDDFIGLTGYTLVDVTPDSVTVRYKTGAKVNMDRIHWEGKSYPVRDDMAIEVETPVKDIMHVWSAGDLMMRDLFEGGSFNGRTISLGSAPGNDTGLVNAIYVGQEAFKKSFKFS